MAKKSKSAFPGIMKLFDYATTMGKGFLSDYSNIESVLGTNIIGKDGSVGSIISFRGSPIMLGIDELNNIVAKLSASLSNTMDKSGHSIEFNFTRDPDSSTKLIAGILHPQRIVARKLDADLDYVFNEQASFLPKWILKESIYLVLWTRPSIFSIEEKKSIDNDKIKQADKDRENKNLMAFLVPQAPDTQHYERASKMILNRHASFVKSVLATSSTTGLSFELLNGHEAIRAVYNSLYPDKTESNWKAILPGDVQATQVRDSADKGKEKVITKWLRDNATDELSAMMWPRIDDQLFTDEAEYVSNRICRIGSNYFSTVDMTTAPLEIMPFMTLLRNTMNQDGREFPWRVSIKIEGDGMKGTGMQSFMAGMLGITTPNGYNRNIKRAILALKERQEFKSEKMVRTRLSFTTWSPVSEGIEQIENRLLSLSKAVEAWGECQVSTISGDPVASTMGTVMGLNMSSTAPSGVVPLRDVLYMLPWSRDVSPWDRGSPGAVLFRTDDGRQFSFDLSSNLQDTSNHLIVGPPGKGKSFLLATVNFAMSVSPTSTDGIGGSKLPYIRCTDIGHSQKGFISTIRNSLPADRQHEVVHKTMKMDTSCAVNMFDTPLGSRYPLPLDANALKNVLSIITMKEDGSMPEHMPDLVGEIIKEAYRKFSDKEPRDSTPKKYDPEVQPEINQFLNDKGVDMSRCRFWWDVVDILALEYKEYHLASVAQRYAVPQFIDLLSLQTESITRQYDIKFEATGLTITKTFQLRLAAAIREYPIFSCPTAFDIRGAQIAVLDIKDICNMATGLLAAKQNALMFMMSRFVLSSDFYQRTEEMDGYNPDYYDFHFRRISHMQSMPKLVEYDEFHRTKGVAFIREQITKDFREGRKYRIIMLLASQSISDFDDDMFTFSSGVWVLGSDDVKEQKMVVERLGLSSVARYRLENSLTGPSPDGSGSPFLVVLKINDGLSHEHYLKNTIGPLMSWAFSTTAEDTALRDMLYKRMPENEARLVLTKRFPNGSARKFITDETKKRANQAGIEYEESQNTSVIEEICNSLYDMWLRLNELRE